jgi:hypothetical protein
LVQQPIPLSALVTPLPVRGGADLVERLFGPLEATCRLADLLNHLYVLIPVLDLKKHCYIDAEEIEKLLAKGGRWLPAHPERDLIARRYLRRRSALAREAIARLAEMNAEAAEAEIEAESAPDADGVVEPARNAASTAAGKCLAAQRWVWKMSLLPALRFCHELHQHTLLAATQRLRRRPPGRLVRPYPLLQERERITRIVAIVEYVQEVGHFARSVTSFTSRHHNLTLPQETDGHSALPDRTVLSEQSSR